MASDRPVMTGLFPDRERRTRIQRTDQTWITNRDINLAMSEDTRKRHFVARGTETELGNRAAACAEKKGTSGPSFLF